MNMKGFTLIETLVAVTIITVAVSGAIFSANRSIVAAQISRDRLTASYLAQEGVEYIRAMRDDAFLADYGTSNDPWADFTNGAPGSKPYSVKKCVDTTCTLDPTQSMGSNNGDSLNPCGNGNGNSCGPLYFDRTNNRYTEQNNLANGVKTPFTRILQITAISNTEENIVSTVTWDFHGTPLTVKTTDHLTPWQ